MLGQAAEDAQQCCKYGWKGQFQATKDPFLTGHNGDLSPQSWPEEPCHSHGSVMPLRPGEEKRALVIHDSTWFVVILEFEDKIV